MSNRRRGRGNPNRPSRTKRREGSFHVPEKKVDPIREEQIRIGRMLMERERQGLAI